MANQEHLDIINEGVNEWNAWRNDHSSLKPDLSYSILQKLFLRKADLKKPIYPVPI